mmetsp:Transcript_40970/g.50452  ORF Transcript_40970/g.50452 Transcript_40970/m.50452 type:complete len:111 (+) Transcript_40970:460-792(+)
MSNDSDNVDDRLSKLEEQEQKLVQGIESLTNKLSQEQGKQSNPNDVACSACPEQKLIYEICMQKWYNNIFLKGKSDGTLPCENEYNIYQKCVQPNLEKLGLKHLVDYKFD